MSIEIYCSRFRDGQPAVFPPGALEAAFAATIVGTEPTALLLDLPGAGHVPTRLSFTGDGAGIRSFVIERPTDDDGLYQGLLRMIQQEGAVAYAPDSPLVVAASASAAHLPADLRAALGGPVTVSSGPALRDALFGP